MKKQKKFFRDLVLAHFILFVSILSIELYLRYVTYKNPYFIYPPGRMEINRETIDKFALKGKAVFSVNSIGFRGQELKSEHNYRVVILGSSTSIGWLLDDKETWPYYLQEKLRMGGKKAWVGIGGLAGNRFVENYLQLENVLENVPKINLVIVMAGGIDFLIRLYQGTYYRPNFLRRERDRKVILKSAFSWIRGPFNLTHWAIPFALNEKRGLPAADVIPPNDFFTGASRFRRTAKVIRSELISLELGLKEVEYHQTAMVNLARAKGVRIVFLTQPVLWDEGLSKEEKGFIWMGYASNSPGTFPWGKKHDEYYSIPALLEGIEMYNSKIKQVSRKFNVDFVDIYNSLPRSADYMFDDAHTNPAGSRFIANEVYRVLREKD